MTSSCFALVVQSVFGPLCKTCTDRHEGHLPQSAVRQLIHLLHRVVRTLRIDFFFNSLALCWCWYGDWLVGDDSSASVPATVRTTASVLLWESAFEPESALRADNVWLALTAAVATPAVCWLLLGTCLPISPSDVLSSPSDCSAHCNNQDIKNTLSTLRHSTID